MAARQRSGRMLRKICRLHKNKRYFHTKNGPGCARPVSSAEFWGRQATARREKVRFEVRCVRSKPETAKQAPNRQHKSGAEVATSQGQKLRLGGDALGADPTYLLCRPFRSRGGI